MDTATLVLVTLMVSVLLLMAAFGLERYWLRRKRAKHAH